MGRFKRSKSQKRFHPQIISVEKLPERFKSIVPIVNNVLFKLSKEKRIKDYHALGLHPNNSVFVFDFKFPFWEKITPHINVFVSKRKDECAISQTKQNVYFEALLGEDITEKSVYDSLSSCFAVVEGGITLESDTVNGLNDFYTKTGKPFWVEKTTEEQDRKQKIDILVFGFRKQPFGVQLKKDIDGWIHHRNKYPKVPSILLDPKTEIHSVARAIEQIANSLERNMIEHINLHIKPPT